MKRLIIAGAGGFGREVFAWAMGHPDCGEQWEIAGFLDDNLSALDAFEYPVGVIGTVDAYEPQAEDVFLCAIGSPPVRFLVCEKLLAKSARFISLIHPSVVIGGNVTLGRGVIICPQAVLTVDISIADFVIINCMSSVGHDVSIGAYTTLSGHCDVTGNVQIGEGTLLGSGARILPGKKIGSDALVGAGAVVIRSVGDDQKVFGNPARRFD
jgi:sugar O-acyltransferase (sialic acid O-acetyltransferase NeuD family)